MMNGQRNAPHDAGKQPGGPPSVFITRRHPEAAESQAKPKDSQRRISALCNTRNEGCPIFRVLCERWERRTPRETHSIVLLTRTLSSRAKKDRPPADDLAQSRDPASADAQ